MGGFGRQTWRAWRDLHQFRRLDPEDHDIVFYVENPADWLHFEAIITELTGALRRGVTYLTSCPGDPLLDSHPDCLRTFYVGAGLARIVAFMYLRANVLVMTTPDLGTLELKRSRVDDVHYVYLFHSMVSTHMSYRETAFDHFDSILCVGPHHVREIRRREELYGLKPKQLVEHGYGRLDRLHQIMLEADSQGSNASSSGARILIAPSWGRQGLLETIGEVVVEALLQDSTHHVTVRPHPRTRTLSPRAIEALERRFGGISRFELETDVAGSDSLVQSHIMVTDWSGAGLEFALAFQRPVLFVDLPRKVNNPAYERLGLEPIEVALREQLGEVLSVQELDSLPRVIAGMLRHRDSYVDSICGARNSTVFNLGRSGRAAAEYLVDLVEHARAKGTAG